MVNLWRSLERVQQNDHRQLSHLLPLLKGWPHFENLCLEVVNVLTTPINEVEAVGHARLILVRVGLHLLVTGSDRS